MAGMAIHLAVGEVYAKYNKLGDKKAFLQGVADPDLLSLGGIGNKIKAHYGDAREGATTVKSLFNSKVNLKKYLTANKLDNDYNIGYFLHLLTDYLFFNRFIYKTEFEKGFKFSMLYDDYEKTNKDMKERYGVKDIYTNFGNVSQEGEPTFFTKKELFDFIEKCGKLDLKEIAKIVMAGNQEDIVF